MPQQGHSSNVPGPVTRAPARLVRLGPGLGPPAQAQPAPRLPPPVRASLPRPVAASRTATSPTAGSTKRGRVSAFVRGHKIATAAIAGLLLFATVGIALVVFSQPFVATPTAGTSPVAFSSGDDITSLVSLGMAATPTIATGGGSASITIYGIPGATALSLGEILELTNTDTADNADFTVALSVAGTPAVTLTAFTLTFLDDVGGTPTLRTWDLLTTPTLTTYTISDAEVWEFTVSSLTMTSAATGSQGALTITATITQV